MILLIDNYDSFTYNIYQMIGEHCPDITVVRNDKINVDAICELAPDYIILSPGPGYPAQAGNMPEIIREFQGKVPMLGVCLGHQGLAENFGARIIEAIEPIHGKSSEISLCADSCLFQGLPKKIQAGRYHSLIVEKNSLPDCLKICAVSCDDDQIMALEHKSLPLFGLQFHPESILSDYGSQILRNFINYL